MRVPRACLCLACLAIVLGTETSQTQEVSKLELRIKEEKPIRTQPASAIVRPVKCDAKGNLYFRPYRHQNMLTAPVIRVSPDGETKNVFSLNAIPRMNEEDPVQIDDFAVGLRGEVYFLATNAKEPDNPELDIFSFSDEASYKFKIKLEEFALAEQIAVFPGGNFLVAGARRSTRRPPAETPAEFGQQKPKTPPPLEPYTAIFDPSGRVVKELTLEGDVNPADKAASEEEQEVARRAITLGTAVSGDDGNIYLMRAATKPLVYVISPGGTVLRKLEVELPSKDMRVVSMHYAPGARLVFEFGQKMGRDQTGPGKFFSLVDAETGQRVLDYELPLPEGAGSFACHASGSFFFLAGTKERLLAVIRVVPR